MARPHPYSGCVHEQGAVSKALVRSTVLARRGERSDSERDAAALELRDQVLTLPEITGVATVAAYVATGIEPGTAPLLAELRRRGVRLLLPVLRDDFDLDWAELTDPERLRPGRFGILEPAEPLLGVDAVREAGVVVCPGVAADAAGHRLGRGGGSYDRVLARLDPSTLRCILLYDDEALDVVPHDDHDQRVDAIVTPRRVIRTSARH